MCHTGRVNHQPNYQVSQPTPSRTQLPPPYRNLSSGGIETLKSRGKNDVISRAIDEIRNSRFGQTPLGREVVARLDELHLAGKISVQDIGKYGGLGGGGWIKISPSVYSEIDSHGKRAHLESVLVHEALHELQALHRVGVGHQHGSTYDPYGYQNLYLAELRSEGRVTRSRPSQ